MNVEVYNKEGQSTGRTVDLPEDIFGVEPNEHAVYLAVKAYNASQHRGTHATKERGQVRGSTKKIKRQKGTGTARAGDIKNPLFRGGGRVFGPRVRSYRTKLNKKVSQLARKSVLSDYQHNGKLKVIENISFAEPKTKDCLAVNKQLNDEGTKSLFILGEQDANFVLSARNLKKVRVVQAEEANIYDLMDADHIFLSENAIEKIKQQLS